MPNETLQAAPALAADGHEFTTRHGGGNFWVLALGSVGVVFGDIGTSPLYALQTALGQFKDTGLGPTEVVGIVSLIIWALLIVVTAKYVLFLMQADNKGEGGILSLTALAQTAFGKRTTARLPARRRRIGAVLRRRDHHAGDLGAFGAGGPQAGQRRPRALHPAGDGGHPDRAVSRAEPRHGERRRVLRADHGGVLRSSTPCLGVMHIPSAWGILRALSPVPGLAFLIAHGAIGFIVLGSVFLAVTGAEALYADMGHFGRRPIQAAWLFLVLPALIANYLGQGALIISDPKAVENPFYLLAPGWGLLPLILLSTAATVIASQAVITGAYSLVSQAIQLGLLPRLEIIHTSDSQEGQIYMPRINRILLLGVLALVLLFRSSDALANAYGIAVSGTMVATTALAFFVVWKLWRWPLWGALALICGVSDDRRQLLHRQPLQGSRRRLGAAAAGMR